MLRLEGPRPGRAAEMGWMPTSARPSPTGGIDTPGGANASASSTSKFSASSSCIRSSASSSASVGMLGMRSRPEGPAPPAKPDIAPAVRRDVNGPRCLLVPEPPLCWMGKKGRSAMSAQPRGVRAKRRGYALTTNFTLDSSSLGVAHRMRSAGFGSGGHSRFSERKRRHPRGGSPGASRALGSAGTATVAEGFITFHSSDKVASRHPRS